MIKNTEQKTSINHARLLFIIKLYKMFIPFLKKSLFFLQIFRMIGMCGWSRNMSKKIKIFTLAMINVAAVSSIRNWPTIAEYGFSSLFFFALAACIFLIPVSMV